MSGRSAGGRGRRREEGIEAEVLIEQIGREIRNTINGTKSLAEGLARAAVRAYHSMQENEDRIRNDGKKVRSGIKRSLLESVKQKADSESGDITRRCHQYLMLLAKTLKSIKNPFTGESRYKVFLVRVRTTSRVLVDVSSPFGWLIDEVGLAFDDILDAPMVPESELKGVLRAYSFILAESELKGVLRAYSFILADLNSDIVAKIASRILFGWVESDLISRKKGSELPTDIERAVAKEIKRLLDRKKRPSGVGAFSGILKISPALPTKAGYVYAICKNCGAEIILHDFKSVEEVIEKFGEGPWPLECGACGARRNYGKNDLRAKLLEPDAITPHYSLAEGRVYEHKAKPTPVTFLTIAPMVELTFLMAIDMARLKKLKELLNDMSDNEKRYLEDALDYIEKFINNAKYVGEEGERKCNEFFCRVLENAFAELGVGAKTAYGYGRMIVVSVEEV